jgi:hypothetical protein
VNDERTSSELREGVRSGIVAALRHDLDLRGGRTARLLLLAGAIGVAGAIGATLLVANHPFDHHPTWHVATFSAVWAGLLIVASALVLLQIRTPALPLARAAAVGLIGLAIAGLCSVACPDAHFLTWWSTTSIGSLIDVWGGLGASTLCFGAVTTVFFAAAAALIAGDPSAHPPLRPLLPSLLLTVLLGPGVLLQSVGHPPSAFAGWLAGSAAGAYLGVATGIGLRALLRAR